MKLQTNKRWYAWVHPESESEGVDLWTTEEAYNFAESDGCISVLGDYDTEVEAWKELYFALKKVYGDKCQYLSNRLRNLTDTDIHHY